MDDKYYPITTTKSLLKIISFGNFVHFVNLQLHYTSSFKFCILKFVLIVVLQFYFRFRFA